MKYGSVIPLRFLSTNTVSQKTDLEEAYFIKYLLRHHPRKNLNAETLTVKFLKLWQ